MEIPSKALLSVEVVRAIYEYGLGLVLNIPLQFISPKGDKHPVMIIPGLGTSDASTHYIRNFLHGIGYTPYSWGLGRNLGPRQGLDKLLLQLTQRVEEISTLHNGQQVSIIGWSLGGIYAREIAKTIPDKVRQVITMGTPFKGDTFSTNATLLYEMLSKDKSHRDPEIAKRISIPPDLPFTSIYSKTDGVVHWSSSLEIITPIHENIEIPGASHLGLGHNPMSMYVVANRLSQKRENWKPYNT
jgi:pimeloyl-ACP methyl ester carboxylesterase